MGVFKKFILILVISFIVMQFYHYLGNPVDKYLFELRLGLPRTLFKSFLHVAFFFFAFRVFAKTTQEVHVFEFVYIANIILVLAIGEEVFDMLKGFNPSIGDILLDIFGASLGYVSARRGFLK